MMRKFALQFWAIMLLIQSLFLVCVSYEDFTQLQITTSNFFITEDASQVFFEQSMVPTLQELITGYPELSFFENLENADTLCVWGIGGNMNFNQKVHSVIDGSFFNEADFFHGKYYAIVGEKLLQSDHCFEDTNSKKYLKYNQHDYEIIGIFSTKMNHMLDHTAFLGLDTVGESYPHLIFCGAKDRNIQDAISSMQDQYACTIQKAPQNNYVARYFFHDVKNSAFYYFMIFFIVLLNIVLITRLIGFFREEIYIKKMIGVPTSVIRKELLSIILANVFASTIMVIMGYGILYKLFLQPMHLSLFLRHLGVFSLCIGGFLCLIACLYLKIIGHYVHINGVR